MSENQPPTLSDAQLWALLATREEQVALMLANGNDNRTIAAALNISIKTVDSHRAKILKKLECKNNVGLTLMAVRLGKVMP